MFIFFLSFIAGVLTVLAPCILTLLPVIVGGSIDGKPNMRRAFIVTGSLGVSVVVFTLLLKATTLLIDIPNTTWSIISGTIIIILGIFTVFPNLWENLGWLNSINRKSNEVIGAGYTKKSTWGDIITGAALGPVFSSCSPTYFFILATVLPQSPIVGFIDIIAYAVGLSGALLVITFAGQYVLNKLGVVANPHGWFKRILGVIFILIGVGIMMGVDKIIQTKILETGFLNIASFERNLIEVQTPE